MLTRLISRRNLNEFFLVIIATLFMWFSLDYIATYFYGPRGFSLFFVSDNKVGHINKPNFSGRYGGFLDSFSSEVHIDSLGERRSLYNNSKNTILFLGDSTTAGFEVNDNQTFVSLFNIRQSKSNGMNFGVRAHDTHEVLGNYKRLRPIVRHSAVFYFVTSNDLRENMELMHYPNLVKKYGRMYNGRYYLPKLTKLESIYFDFRIYISDHFYLTTKFIDFAEKLVYKYSHSNIPSKSKSEEINSQRIEVLTKLVGELEVETSKVGATLYVAGVPCLDEPDCPNLKLELALKDHFAGNDKIKIITMANDFNKSFISREIDPTNMRFRNDGHLTKYGHQVVASYLSKKL